MDFTNFKTPDWRFETTSQLDFIELRGIGECVCGAFP